VSSVCSQVATACFVSTSVTNRLPARCKEMETAGPNLAAEPIISSYAMAGRSRTSLPAVLLSSSPVSEQMVIRYIESRLYNVHSVHYR